MQEYADQKNSEYGHFLRSAHVLLAAHSVNYLLTLHEITLSLSTNLCLLGMAKNLFKVCRYECILASFNIICMF